jgi:hypothetical protein
MATGEAYRGSPDFIQPIRASDGPKRSHQGLDPDSDLVSCGPRPKEQRSPLLFVRINLRVDGERNMRWLLNVIMKWLRRDDPKITPIPVRASSALLIMAFGVIMECNLTLRHSLAACSILLVVFAAGIRYWETVATDQDLQRVGNEIAYIGSCTKLSVGDSVSVIAFAHLGFIMAYLYSAQGVLIAKQNPNQLKLPIGLALIVVWIYFVCSPIVAYLGSKMGRCLCSRWRKRLQRDTSTAEIKRILRLTSFAITLVAGVLQLPNVLS